MNYDKNYCEEKEISVSKLNEAQRTLYYIAENMKMDKSISEAGYKHFQMAIEALDREPLTDTEQRIFLAAMGREEKVCRKVDEKYPDKEPYEDSLMSVCRSIKRKVKKALWE